MIAVGGKDGSVIDAERASELRDGESDATITIVARSPNSESGR
jgi:hypothetical protein